MTGPFNESNNEPQLPTIRNDPHVGPLHETENIERVTH